MEVIQSALLKSADSVKGSNRSGLANRFLFIAVALILALTVGVLFILLHFTPSVTSASVSAAGLFDELDGMQLVDQDGDAFRLAGLSGKVVLLNFVLTGCSTICPTQTRELAALQQALPATLLRDVRFVSVSVDPLGDTPALLKAYGLSAGADFSSWTFATGRPQDIERLDRRLGLFREGIASSVPADHTAALWLIDGNGRLMQRYTGAGVDQPRLILDMRQVHALGVPSG